MGTKKVKPSCGKTHGKSRWFRREEVKASARVRRRREDKALYEQPIRLAMNHGHACGPGCLCCTRTAFSLKDE